MIASNLDIVTINRKFATGYATNVTSRGRRIPLRMNDLDRFLENVEHCVIPAIKYQPAGKDDTPILVILKA